MKLINKSNDYIKTMDAWDVGLLKTCLLSCGILLGVTMNKENKKKLIAASGITYLATAIAVLVPYVQFLLNEEENK